MDDVAPAEYAYVWLSRREDGDWSLAFHLCEMDGLVTDNVVRLYNTPGGVTEAADDGCRLLCAWAAVGALGVSEALTRMRALDRY